MCAQTRARFVLSSERVLGSGVRTHVNSKGKIPSTGKFSPMQDRTHDATSSRTASPTHYQRAIPAPDCLYIRMVGRAEVRGVGGGGGRSAGDSWVGGLTSGRAVSAVPMFECPKIHGLYRDPEDCRFFYHCFAGRHFRHECQFGTVFSTERKLCTWPLLVPECQEVTQDLQMTSQFPSTTEEVSLVPTG